MRCLITGGCGFLGSNVAWNLLSAGLEISILDNLSRLGARQNLDWLQSNFRLHTAIADVRNADEVNKSIRAFQPDCVIHLAGQVAMTSSLQNPRHDFNVNAIGTLNVLEAIRQYRPNCGLIYSSTNKVYGDLEYLNYTENDLRYCATKYPMGFDETLNLDFRSPYGCSKGSADQYVLDYARHFEIRATVLRHSSMYGGRQFATVDQGWVGWFFIEARRQLNGDGRPFTISGNGKQVRDVLHCDDTVVLYKDLALNIDSVRGHAFNIGGGITNSVSLRELLNWLEIKISRPLAYTTIKPRESDQKFFVADLRKIQSMTKWTPKISYQEGFNRMLDWIESEEYSELNRA
jgi:CDP-paratose 2-epimerase